MLGNGEAKRLTHAIAPNAKRCAGCGRILTRLPSNAVCLNESCELAGRLIPYLPNMALTDKPAPDGAVGGVS